MSLYTYLFKYKYLNDETIKGFDLYKYNSKDTSPLSNYVMHPFWNWLIQFFPMWLAPNLMTLLGFLCLVLNFGLLLYYDPNFYASSIDHPEFVPIPAVLWLVAAFLNFASHTLDGLDGKQARRTKSSSPVGEMFDHGLDSWATFFFPMCIWSVFGRGMFGGDCVHVYYTMMVVIGLFILSHWEKYVTGVFFLPWGYDVSQIGLTLVYIFTFFAGYEYWQNYFYGTTYTYGNMFILLVQLGFWVLSLPLTLLNVVKSYIRNEHRATSLVEIWRPLVSPGCLMAASMVYVHYSPNNMLVQYPRMFFIAFATAYSNVSCKLIVAQMSNTRIPLTNLLAAVYCVMVAVVMLASPSETHEFYILLAYDIFVIFMHIHFGCNAVNQMLDHFGLRAFLIRPSTKSSKKH